MAVGQRYVHYLLEKDYINGNLFYLMTAYNAGPGNLLKWEKKANYNDDPLLFIEIIPARETRLYIERVMANYWIYQSRFEQELTGIDALINGQWPMLDKKKKPCKKNKAFIFVYFFASIIFNASSSVSSLSLYSLGMA